MPSLLTCLGDNGRCSLYERTKGPSQLPSSYRSKAHGLDRKRADGWLGITRQQPGYHDELLRGEWAGYRSIRLSRSYRAIYAIQNDGTVEFALVESVSKAQVLR